MIIIVFKNYFKSLIVSVKILIFILTYNDIYFVDDALPNVQAVKHVMEQLDIKGSSVQAKIKFSQEASINFNNISY